MPEAGDIRERFDLLAQGYIEGDLTPVEAQEFHKLLRTDPGLAQVVLEFIRDDALICEVVEAEEDAATALLTPIVDRRRPPSSRRGSITSVTRRVAIVREPEVEAPRWTLVALLGVAATLMLAAALIFYMTPFRKRRNTVVVSPGTVPSSSEPGRTSRARRRVARPRRSARRIHHGFAPIVTADGSTQSSRTTDAADVDGDALGVPSRVVEAPPAPAVRAGAKLIGYVDSMHGDVEVALDLEGPWSPVDEGRPVYAGEWLRTKFARARVAYESGTDVRIDRFTTLRIAAKDRAPGLTMIGGQVLAAVAPGDVGYYVETPHGSVIDLGTVFGVAITRVSGTEIFVVKGRVEASTDAGAVRVMAEQQVALSSRLLPPGKVVPARDLKRRMAWGGPPYAEPNRLAAFARTRPNVVALWRFDEGWGAASANLVQNKCNMRLVRSSWGRGVSGTALRLDGTGFAYARPESVARAFDDEVTVAAWIYCESMAGEPTIADAVFPGGVGEFWFHVGGKGLLQLQTGSGPYAAVGARRPIDVGVWTHVAATSALTDEGMRARLYVDGKAVPLVVHRTASIATPPQPLLIGAATTSRRPEVDGVDCHFVGMIDDVWVCAKELALEEIQLLAARPAPGTKLADGR